MRITSPAFHDGEQMPREYAREGDDRSPPLRIEDVPLSAESLALIMDDPDAPRGTFTHWVLFDFDPQTFQIAENHPPQDARLGLNDWGEARYGGPMPPSGEHRYCFRLYALDARMGLPDGATRKQLENAMLGHVIDTAEFMGRYAKNAPAEAGVR